MSKESSGATGPTDSDALRIKYREERDKRLRKEGTDQYIKPTGNLASIISDSYIKSVERAPVNKTVKVAIIGAGFSGLCTGARIKEAGIDDVCLIDSAGDVGGVWYWNRYPGAMCDTAAMIYLPLLEETGYVPTKKYVYAAEIFAHAQRIANHYKLYDNAMLSTAVSSLNWDEKTLNWVIRTDRGDTITAKYVAMGTGPINEPKLPGVEGIEKFKGHAFHTSRWDYQYTGGDFTNTPMTNLADKRVAMLGTGATGIQIVPFLSRDAKELHVIQRTPSSIDVRNNREFTADELADLKPGWQTEWLENFATLQSGGMAEKDLVQDGWTDITRRIREKVMVIAAREKAMNADIFQQAYAESDDEKMNEIRARVDTLVDDYETAQGLKPWYRQLCKRPCFHDEYLQSYNRPNTHLVDTNGQGVERIDETGVWANGTHYEVDLIVFASGFEVNLSHSASYETTGCNGLKLSDYWGEGMQSLHGTHVHGFPNLFIIAISQAANLISNITHNLSESGTSIATILSYSEEIGAQETEVTQEAEQKWVGLFDENPMAKLLSNPECTPGYYNNEGKPADRKDRLNASGYPQGPVAYFKHLRKWCSTGEFEGLKFRANGESI